MGKTVSYLPFMKNVKNTAIKQRIQNTVNLETYLKYNKFGNISYLYKICQMELQKNKKKTLYHAFY